MKLALLFVLSCLAIGFLTAPVNAQSLPEPRQSPLGLSRAMIGDVYVKVVYGRPYARDREIFGSLVPFGEVWRTGANEATEITLTGTVRFGNTELEAGTYSLFTIPDDSEWTIIINEQLGQWGAYAYNSDHDLSRFTVPTQSAANYAELFTISVDKTNEVTGHLVIEWEQTRVEIPISR